MQEYAAARVAGAIRGASLEACGVSAAATRMMGAATGEGAVSAMEVAVQGATLGADERLVEGVDIGYGFVSRPCVAGAN